MSELYLYECDEQGVATVTLNRPEIHNAFNDDLITALTKKFSEISSDETVKVVVLTGAGKSFCAGADLNWMKSMIDYSKEENIKDSQALSDLFQTINNCSRPVIGKINGAALGGGAGLVAVCDYVIASEKALFGFTEVMLGLVPAVISPFVVAKIGESNARATFLTGDRFDASKASVLGLVHQVSADGELDKDCDELIKKFVRPAPRAQAVAKDLIRNVISLQSATYEQVSKYTCETIAERRVSSEGQEGMNALLEKRRPNWKKDS